MRIFSLTFSFLFASLFLQAQPDTDVYLFKINNNDGAYSFTDLVKVTDRKGYDNQAYFTPDSKSLRFTSMKEGEKSDIFKYVIETGEMTNLTNTPNSSEYSPISMPDGEHFSVVMVEEDDKTQKLWQFPNEGGEGKRVFEDIEPVGYYTWYRDTEAAMFILGETFTLQAATIEEGKPKVIADKIGRSIHTIPGTEQVSFVNKESDEKWTINRWDPESGEISLLTETLAGSEDYCWHPAGFMIMNKGSELFMHGPTSDGKWESLGDLGVGEFYRVNISPDGEYLVVIKVKE